MGSQPSQGVFPSATVPFGTVAEGKSFHSSIPIEWRTASAAVPLPAVLAGSAAVLVLSWLLCYVDRWPDRSAGPSRRRPALPPWTIQQAAPLLAVLAGSAAVPLLSWLLCRWLCCADRSDGSLRRRPASPPWTIPAGCAAAGRACRNASQSFLIVLFRLTAAVLRPAVLASSLSCCCLAAVLLAVLCGSHRATRSYYPRRRSQRPALLPVLP